MGKVVAITGASAGVGRAVTELFAAKGWDVGLMARGQERLEAAAEGVRAHGQRACAIPTDVADSGAVEAAADRIEQELGPIDVWINVAMATVFAPIAELKPEEVLRGTQVTYLGQVHGMMAALARMRPRNRGMIVNVGSALAYRAIPLQSVYCASKFAVRGFTDSLRTELLHDKSKVHVTMVQLAAMNTPQFDWARDRMAWQPRPVAPVFEPEVAARAIYFAATHKRREVWVGWPTVEAIFGNKIAPGLADRILAGKMGWEGQLSSEPRQGNGAGNLFEPVPGPYGARGRFGAESKNYSSEMWTSRHRAALTAVVGLVMAAGADRLARDALAWLFGGRRRERNRMSYASGSLERDERARRIKQG
jgi:short-subunit dehydrogenase